MTYHLAVNAHPADCPGCTRYRALVGSAVDTSSLPILLTGFIYYQDRPSLKYLVREWRTEQPHFVEIRSLGDNHVTDAWLPLSEVAGFLAEHREY